MEHPNQEGLDLLRGAKGIGDFMGLTERQTINLLVKGKIPAIKVGNIYMTTRTKIRNMFEGERA